MLVVAAAVGAQPPSNSSPSPHRPARPPAITGHRGWHWRPQIGTVELKGGLRALAELIVAVVIVMLAAGRPGPLDRRLRMGLELESEEVDATLVPPLVTAVALAAVPAARQPEREELTLPVPTSPASFNHASAAAAPSTDLTPRGAPRSPRPRP